MLCMARTACLWQNLAACQPKAIHQQVATAVKKQPRRRSAPPSQALCTPRMCGSSNSISKPSAARSKPATPCKCSSLAPYGPSICQCFIMEVARHPKLQAQSPCCSSAPASHP